MSAPAAGDRPSAAYPPPSRADLAAVARQLGRRPRGVRGVAHRCRCGDPDVVQTEPRLADGTPFPTLYYLTCPRAAAMIGTLEAEGLMRDMEQRLARDESFARDYRLAHTSYLAERQALGDDPRIATVSAGGMPSRVKCLHALVAHSLAVGPGVNPVGDHVLSLLPDWGRSGRCTVEERPSPEQAR